MSNNTTTKFVRNTPRKVSANSATKSDKPRRSDSRDNKWRGYRYVYEVYPDNGWDPKWGDKPFLGYVRADSEFNAKYAAYDAGLLPYNVTFGPQVRRVTKHLDLEKIFGRP